MANSYEQHRRTEKLLHLCRVVDALAADRGLTPPQIADWLRRLPIDGPEASWASLAACAAVRPASGATRLALIELYEKTADVDPFARCGGAL